MILIMPFLNFSHHDCFRQFGFKWRKCRVFAVLNCMSSSLFSLLEQRFFSFCGQKFSLWIRHSYRITLSWFLFVNLSVIVNLACSLNLWSLFWQSLSTYINLGTFTSFAWLFNVVLDGVSFIPTYSTLHKINGIFCLTTCIVKYIPNFVFFVGSWRLL